MNDKIKEHLMGSTITIIIAVIIIIGIITWFATRQPKFIEVEKETTIEIKNME